jgi:orotidine-5'-phosphate decarboxylase
MIKRESIEQIKIKKSFLCVGLDPELSKIPKHLLDLEDPIFEFNKAIIDATKEFCVAYKPNIAFYECLGSKGWDSLQKTVEYIPENIFTIADAKRGDIGNTSAKYAETFFSTYNFDSITVSAFMGADAVLPYLEHKGKWSILLGLTSNEGAKDFQLLKSENGNYWFEDVITKSAQWGNDENMMYVVGATRGELFTAIRKIVPNHFLLVPGVGAQGGSLEDTVKYGWNNDCGLLINSSRGIIYAGNGNDFAQKSKLAAQEVQQQMQQILLDKNWI